MHDWTLLSILIELEKGIVTINFKTEFGYEILIAEGIFNLVIPKHDAWGKSESVNRIEEPTQLDNGNYLLNIEMQSGDTITLEAKIIHIPVF